MSLFTRYARNFLRIVFVLLIWTLHTISLFKVLFYSLSTQILEASSRYFMSASCWLPVGRFPSKISAVQISDCIKNVFPWSFKREVLSYYHSLVLKTSVGFFWQGHDLRLSKKGPTWKIFGKLYYLSFLNRFNISISCENFEIHRAPFWLEHLRVRFSLLSYIS